MPFWISFWILSHWIRDTTGPMVVPSARGSPALVLSATPLAIAATSFIFDSGTIIRDGALQDCPELLNICITPPATALARSAPSRMMFGDLPPSSWLTRFTVGAARLATSTPARVEPVNEIMSMPGCSLMAAPTSGPRPLIRLNTPFGTPASCRISAKISADDGVNSDGFRIMVQPAAGAGLQLLGHRQRRAHLVGDGSADILHAALVDFDDLAEQRHALLATGLRKRLERALGRGHGLVDVGLGAERNLIHRLFSRRVDDGRGFLDDGIDPGAIDIKLHAVDHR